MKYYLVPKDALDSVIEQVALFIALIDSTQCNHNWRRDEQLNASIAEKRNEHYTAL